MPKGNDRELNPLLGSVAIDPKLIAKLEKTEGSSLMAKLLEVSQAVGYLQKTEKGEQGHYN